MVQMVLKSWNLVQVTKGHFKWKFWIFPMAIFQFIYHDLYECYFVHVILSIGEHLQLLCLIYTQNWKTEMELCLFHPELDINYR